MEIQILGPLVLAHRGRTATPTAPKTRSVLGLLLLNADQAVPAAALTRELWGASPPVSAPTTVQTYVLQIRKCFGTLLDVPVAEVARRVLVTVPGGYLLRVDPDGFDLRRFERLAGAGRRALAAGDLVDAAALLVRACALWRGPVLADVRAGVVAGPRLKALEETRLTTVEQCIEARMRLGHHQDVLADLTLLIAEHRLNENLCAQLMVALHRSGQRREALAVFQRLRASMVGELGLEPSKRLHLLQQAILTDDPALEVAPRDDGLTQLLDHLVLQRARAR
ncbi:AfsR/SARP family transcriptional regulator [Micromonospora sp. WMMD987]|jgi:DNA-binding SARP family transcriptional activator|uniref:AfsR/SARP family transcriptional regulator n=1 Tax=Micromonospora TaxID=1873 RepID=UPI00249C44EE|nr:AfsR/SARP family transcriptional regulator [Micromonospora sp. WMMD987]WFE97619.1 AfsR/SARP family transcriptional regulator [Micromonospora sp. WMMD987]